MVFQVDKEKKNFPNFLVTIIKNIFLKIIKVMFSPTYFTSFAESLRIKNKGKQQAMVNAVFEAKICKIIFLC